MNKNDLRYQKTEQNIKTSFLACVDRLGFEKTTISDICAQGMMSRNTFYTHYEDKYVLLGSIYRDLEKEFSQSYTAEMQQQLLQYDITRGMSWYIDIVVKNHELLRVLLKCPAAEFEDLLLRSIVLTPIRPLVPDLDKRLEELPVQLNITYMFQAMIHFTRLWLAHYDSLPKEIAAAELGNLCDGPSKLFLKKLLEPDRKI